MPRLVPDAEDDDLTRIQVHVINQQIARKTGHQPFTSAILSRMALEREIAKTVTGSLDRCRNRVSRISVFLGNECADLPEISFGRTRPNYFHVEGGGSSSGLPHESSHLHMSAWEITRPAATSARASAIARRLASRSASMVGLVSGIAIAVMWA